MKKVKSRAAEDDMRREYDFTGAVRGKYFERFQQGSNLVLLEPDVSAAFPTSEAVNQALRRLASERSKRRVIRRSLGPQRRTHKGTAAPSAKAKRRGTRR